MKTLDLYRDNILSDTSVQKYQKRRRRFSSWFWDDGMDWLIFLILFFALFFMAIG